MMRLLSYLAAPALALALLAGAALAQGEPGPSHVAAAREVVVSSGMHRSFEQVLPQYEQRIRQQLVAQPQHTAAVDDVFKTLAPEMELQKQAMINRAALAVARRMSEAELKEVAGFFNSPVGKRYVELQPVILDDILGEMDTWSRELAEYLQVRVRVEMNKRGHVMQ